MDVRGVSEGEARGEARGEAQGEARVVAGAYLMRSRAVRRRKKRTSGDGTRPRSRARDTVGASRRASTRGSS